MATTKITIYLDAEVAREARHRAGPRGPARLVNTAVRLHVQAIRLREAEAELAARYGPITDEARQHVAAIEWPR